jgi:hypothetical protein
MYMTSANADTARANADTVRDSASDALQQLRRAATPAINE